jgi:hypothetical protein
MFDIARLLEHVDVAHRVLLQHAPKLLDDGTLHFSTPSGPCLDGRSHMIAHCLGLAGPANNLAQIPAALSHWAGSRQPIFRIFSVLQRQPVDAPRLHRLHPLA